MGDTTMTDASTSFPQNAASSDSAFAATAIKDQAGFNRLWTIAKNAIVSSKSQDVIKAAQDVLLLRAPGWSTAIEQGKLFASLSAASYPY
jgi:hypothetical protein